MTCDGLTDDDEVLAESLQSRLEDAARILGIADCALSVVLTGDEALHRLNLAYRGTDAPTDVLSFPADAGATEPDEPRYLGDVLISVERAAVQAQAVDASLESELALLGVHGMLHLFGYDDATDEGRDAMEAREREAGVR